MLHGQAKRFGVVGSNPPGSASSSLSDSNTSVSLIRACGVVITVCVHIFSSLCGLFAESSRSYFKQPPKLTLRNAIERPLLALTRPPSSIKQHRSWRTTSSYYNLLLQPLITTPSSIKQHRSWRTTKQTIGQTLAAPSPASTTLP